MDLGIVSWLVSVPANDGNFKENLARASSEEVNEALRLIKEKSLKGNKTKIDVLSRAFKKKQTAENNLTDITNSSFKDTIPIVIDRKNITQVNMFK